MGIRVVRLATTASLAVPLAALGAAGATGAPTAPKRGPTTITVTLGEYSVALSRASVAAGTRVRFVVVNTGHLVHEAVLERAGADNRPLRQNGKHTEVEHVVPGSSRSAVWTLTKPGDYQLACHVGNHYKRGMVAVLHVR